MSRNAAESATRPSPPTPLWGVCAVSFLASIGTGVVWNGVPFIAKHDYGFTQRQTLWLYVVLGLTYVIGAMSTSRVLQFVESRLSPRSVLALILGLEAAVCASLALVKAGWMLTLVACAISVLSSFLWPIIESYLTAGRHGRDMRRAIGWWNMSWTSAVAIALVLMMPMMHEQPSTVQVAGFSIRLEPRLAIIVLGLLHAVALIPLMWFERIPGSHDAAKSDASIQREYPFLLRAARVLLPLGYVLNAAMSPLMPYVLERIGVHQQWETPVTSMWMWIRIIAMAGMWQLGFWHGRWGTLLIGAFAMALGFGLVVTASSLAMIMIGLGFFGAGLGILYYATLYYAMSVGRAEVDAGGTFEALIGVGYAVGPLAGLAGLNASATAEHVGWHVRSGAAIVAVVLLLVALAGFAAVRAYADARRQRRAPSTGTVPRR